MKSLKNYILEALKTDVQKWLKQVLEAQMLLIKNGKVEKIEIDIENLNKPERPFEYDQYSNDLVFKKLILNKLVGFDITGQIIKGSNKYLKDGEKELTPQCLPYWHQSKEKNIYAVGLCLYDVNKQYIDQYIHVVSLESSTIVENSLDLNKAMLSDFGKTMKKQNGNIIGMTSKAIDNKHKSELIKMGFSVSKENQDLFVYKI